MNTFSGLSCGFWSEDPDEVDKHLLQHVSRGDADGLYDLCSCHYSVPEDRTCREGVS